MSGTFRPLAATFALGALLALAAPAPAQKPFDDPVLDRMQKDIFFLASPECEGRGVGTKGIDKAADYIAAAFQKAGLKPAMKDGSFFQPFTVPMPPSLGKPTALTFRGPDAKKEPALDSDFAVMGFSRTGQAKADLVFAGYGITAPALKYDDYDGLNVEGKIVVVLRRTPRYDEKGDKRFDTTVPDGETSPHAAFVTKIELAAKHKAAALIIVNDTTAAAGDADPLPKFDEFATGTTPAKFPVLMVKRAVLDDLLAAGKHKSLKGLEAAIGDKLKPQSFALTGWTADAQVTVERKDVPAKNVVGVLEGSGPLKDETVVIGAHYDHVGYGEYNSAGGTAAKGKIHYGADDNASGTTGLIELARRYGEHPNRRGRRLVFIAFSGEEMGLVGSKFYCKEPLFPLDRTVAMLNMDMIGRTKPVPVDWLGLFGKRDQLLVYGTGSGGAFDGMVDAVGRKFDFKVSKIPAGTGPSDHDSFYRKQVPVLFLFTGFHGEYHRPTDVPEKINVPGMKKTTDFAETLADDVLTRAERPKYLVVPEGHGGGTVRLNGPRLGILPNYLYEGTGVLLESVSPGGVAEKAGLKDGDVIVEIGGKPTPNVTAYMGVMATQKPGTTVDVVVERKGKKLTLKAELK